MNLEGDCIGDGILRSWRAGWVLERISVTRTEVRNGRVVSDISFEKREGKMEDLVCRRRIQGAQHLLAMLRS